MKDDELVKLAAVVVIGVVVVPILLGYTLNLVDCVYCGVTNKINKMKFNKKMKKGLEDGSIIEVDGQYYTVEKA
jgi:hypothetical protein